MKPPSLSMPFVAPLLLILVLSFGQRLLSATAATEQSPTSPIAQTERLALHDLASQLRTGGQGPHPIHVAWKDTDAGHSFNNSVAYDPNTGRLVLTAEGVSLTEPGVPPAAILAADQATWSASFSGAISLAYKMRNSRPGSDTSATAL